MIDVAAALALGWTFATASVTLFAWLRSAKRATTAAARTVDATLFRPCAGDEPSLALALASSSEAGELGARIRFLVGSTDDAAWPTARRVADELVARGLDAEVIVTAARGPNHKADQLARGFAAAPAALVMVADSDVVLRRDLVVELASSDADACWAPPIEIAPRTSADRVSACLLDGSLHAFGLLSALDPAGMVGKVFAIRRDALEAVGGFEALVDRLGEDMELARRLRALGRRVVAVPSTTWSLASGRGWSRTIDRYARWITVIRAQRPALLVSYPLLFGAAPLQLALAAISHEPLLVGSIVLAARLLGATFARVRSGRRVDAGLFFFALAADLLLLTAFLVGISRRRFAWRGNTLAIGAGGALVASEVER